ncbi:YhgE/Pip family protein [Georgenia alba]|uniref:YhgE/Pip family protein n=1 Tax=Georgenia alba TaxID=2233858 RepID=A0ABW2QB17_9MICO
MSATTATARKPGRRPGTVIALILLPLVVLGVLLAALWQPQERLDTVRAAIVNHDEPVQVEGQTVPLGRQLASGLVGGGDGDVAGGGTSADGATNYTWEITDAEHATAGLADGTYGAVVTIPEDFSAAATSYSGEGTPHQATIDVATPEGGRILDDALAQVVAGTATDVLSQTLTETYVENLLVGFTTLNEQLGEAAGGAAELAGGTEGAADGAAELADGAAQLAEGAAGAGQGAEELAGGADELASGSSELAGGAQQVADGVAGSAQGAHELADGMDEWAAGSEQLAGGTEQLAGGLQQLSDEVSGARQGVDEMTQQYGWLLDTVAPLVRQAAEDCASGEETPVACEDVQAASDLIEGAQSGTHPLAQLDGALQQMSSSADQLATGMGQSAAGARELAGGGEDLAVGLEQLAGGASGVATGADELASGSGDLAEGVGGLASGVGELATGTDELATGTDGLATGLSDLADGTGELADGIGQAAEQVPSYDNAADVASVAAQPVAGPGDDIGSGASGPLFVALSLWLGALVLFVVLPAVPARTFGSTHGIVRLALSALRLPAAIGALTGAAAGLVLAGVQGLGVGGWVGLAVVGALVSVAFVAVNQSLVAALGYAGSGLSVVVAIVMLATGVVSTAPPILLTARDVLPGGPAVDALSAVVFSGVGGLAGAVAVLVLWALVGVAVTTLAVRSRRRVRAAQLLAA